MKPCSECAYCNMLINPDDLLVWTCHRPGREHASPVDGKTMVIGKHRGYRACVLEREKSCDDEDVCGPEGKYWKPVTVRSPVKTGTPDPDADYDEKLAEQLRRDRP